MDRPMMLCDVAFLTIKKATLLSGLLLAGLSISLPASTFEERRSALLSASLGQALPAEGGSGKQPYGIAIARLNQNPQDPQALAFVANSGYGGELFFNSIGQVRALYMGRPHFSAAQLNSIAATATGVNNWFNLGTENHRLMVWSSSYLLAQAFPGASWNWGGQSINSATLRENVKTQLRQVGRNRYGAGYAEFLSPNYEIFHLAALINLYDYADDPEVRTIAESMLHYHFANLAQGSMQEFIMAPYSRVANQSRTNFSNAQWVLWLYWGHGAPVLPVDASIPINFFAVSSWRMHPVVDSIALDPGLLNYTARWQQTHFNFNPVRYIVRTTHHNNGIALSSGVMRHVPEAFQLDDSLFSVAWKGTAMHRLIEAMHPYWRGPTGGENGWGSRTSPFMQIGQYRSAAILLFDIPSADPWPGQGQWAGERVGDVIPLAQIRYPLHMALVQDFENGWFFLRDGAHYVGIKALQPGAIRDRRSIEEQGYHVIKSRGVVGERWSTGFIVEVGTSKDFANFEAFQLQCKSNALAVDWQSLTVTYTTNEGAEMVFTFNTSNETPNGTIPQLEVDGVEADYVNWPVVESPWMELSNQVFEIGNAFSGLSIDWTGEIPTIASQPDWQSEVVPAPGGWLNVPWYGWVWDGGYFPWTWHVQHGWQSAEISADGNSLFVFDLELNQWVWIAPDFYPWIYLFENGGGWYYYFPQTTEPRWFYRDSDGELLTGEQLSLKP